MTNITKAAQDALAALDEIHAGKRHPQLALAVAQQLRAALQDKAGEVRGDLSDDDLDKIDMDAEAEANKNPEGDQRHWRKAYLRAFARNLFAAQPATVAPDVVRYRTIRDGLVYIEPHESGEIYVAGETGVYTKSGDEFDAAIDAIAASQQKG